MAATARPRASCSGVTWQGFTFFLNLYIETKSMQHTQLFMKQCFQLPSDRRKWKVVNCQGMINYPRESSKSQISKYLKSLNRAWLCPTSPRRSWPPQGRSCARSATKLWKCVRHEQVATSRVILYLKEIPGSILCHSLEI